MIYSVSNTNIHVENSYTMTKRRDIRNFLIDVRNKYSDYDVVKQLCLYEMINEWRFHNRLYRLGYEVERTKSVDINIPIKWYIRLAYWIFGI